MLAPHHIPVDVGRPRDPWMVRWVALMAYHSEGGEIVRFPLTYFRWLECQIFVIEDFPYVGMDIRDDWDMPLPPGAQWDESGKKYLLTCSNF